MKLRNVIFELAARYELDRYSTKELQTMAGLLGQPAWLPARLTLGSAIAGAALLGLGILFWIAANWDILGRFGRIALIQGILAASLVATWNYPSWRSISALVATASIGGLLACLGQTYPTGADAWQLFALWAVLALPLSFAARSDVVWMPWQLVALLAIRLYIDQTQPGYTPHLPSHAAGWLVAMLLVGCMGPRFRHLTGSGNWSMRSSAIGAAAFISESCYRISSDNDALLLALPLLGAAILLAAQLEPIDLPVIAIFTLTFDVLFTALAASLLDSSRIGFIASLCTLALIVIATFFVSVHHLAKLHQEASHEA